MRFSAASTVAGGGTITLSPGCQPSGVAAPLSSMMNVARKILDDAALGQSRYAQSQPPPQLQPPS